MDDARRAQDELIQQRGVNYSSVSRLLGRNAAAHPQLVRRALSEGHTLGHHTYSHPLLNRMALPRAEAEIDRGIAADEVAIYGSRRPALVTPFFRFPALPPTRRSSTAWRRAGSWSSVPTSGPATGLP